MQTDSKMITHAVMVVLLTKNYKLIGHLHVPEGRRVTDVICDAEKFIALTDVSVWSLHGEEKIFTAQFIDIERDSIEILLPVDQVVTEGDDIGYLGAWLWQYRQSEAMDEDEDLDLS